MTKNSEGIVLDGVVSKVLPNAFFEVTIDGGHVVVAYVSGKMRMNFVRLMPGDRVSVEVSPYDLKKGRIILRRKG